MVRNIRSKALEFGSVCRRRSRRSLELSRTHAVAPDFHSNVRDTVWFNWIAVEMTPWILLENSSLRIAWPYF
jgi:hypothetical protein